MKREIASGMKQFRAFLDKVIQTAGNGVLGTISAIGGNTFTMAVPIGRGARLRGPDAFRFTTRRSQPSRG